MAEKFAPDPFFDFGFAILDFRLGSGRRNLILDLVDRRIDARSDTSVMQIPRTKPFDFGFAILDFGFWIGLQIPASGDNACGVRAAECGTN